MRFTIICTLLASACAVDRTSSVTSAVNTDPGTTSLSFHSPSGMDIQIQSVTPTGQADPIYLKYSGITGEATNGNSKDVMFRGDIFGAKDPEQYAAALAPLAAALLGQTSTDQVQETIGFTYGAVQIQYVDQNDTPPCEVANVLVQQAVAFAALKEGPSAGVLANSYLSSLAIDPCLVVK